MRRIGSKVVKCLVVAALCTLPMQGFAATGQNQVVSISIKPADGATGQNVLLGSGVKTGHIQDGAITDAKITGIISGGKLGAHGHNASDLVGTVNASNLPIGAVNGTVAAGDHSHDSAYQKKYANVIVVAKSGGDFTDPVAAVNSITTASATNPYLVKIMPGVYDLGGTIIARSFIDIEGSGENITLLKGGIASDNNEIRQLTVENAGGGTESVAIRFFGSGKLTHVTAKASGAIYSNIGIIIGSGNLSDVTVEVVENTNANNWGIVANNTTALNSVSITAANGNANYAIGAGGGELSMNNVTAKAYKVGGLSSFGMWAFGGTVSIKNSSLYGETEGISASVPVSIQNSTIKGFFSLDMSVPSNIALSKLDGPIGMVSGSKCFNVYDSNYLPVTCP